MILVDTCVWSLGLRRQRKDLSAKERRIVFGLRELIVAGRACLIGPIQQELLSGIPDEEAFDQLAGQVGAQAVLPVDAEVWRRAAWFFNMCRRHGIAPDAIDMTICAAAEAHGVSILTVDPDFERYARCLPIRLETV